MKKFKMRCGYCVNYEVCSFQGIRKTSKAPKSCYSPNYTMLPDTFEEIRKWMSHLTIPHFKLFRRLLKDGEVLRDNKNLTPREAVCGNCVKFSKCKHSPKAKDYPIVSHNCDDWSLDLSGKFMPKEFHKLSDILKPSFLRGQWRPYLDFFIKKQKIVNKIKPAHVKIGDKIAYRIELRYRCTQCKSKHIVWHELLKCPDCGCSVVPFKMAEMPWWSGEVYDLTDEFVKLRDKGGVHVDIIYKTLLSNRVREPYTPIKD